MMRTTCPVGAWSGCSECQFGWHMSKYSLKTKRMAVFGELLIG